MFRKIQIAHLFLKKPPNPLIKGANALHTRAWKIHDHGKIIFKERRIGVKTNRRIAKKCKQIRHINRGKRQSNLRFDDLQFTISSFSFLATDEQKWTRKIFRDISYIGYKEKSQTH